MPRAEDGEQGYPLLDYANEEWEAIVAGSDDSRRCYQIPGCRLFAGIGGALIGLALGCHIAAIARSTLHADAARSGLACGPPCAHGTCKRKGDDGAEDERVCACDVGWEGAQCAHSASCGNAPCGVHGDCKPLGLGYSCSCHPGWNGGHCDRPTGCDPEAGSSDGVCKHGRCVPDGKQHTCVCEARWSGPSCDRPQTGFGGAPTHIVGVSPEATAFIEAALPPASRYGNWALCYDSRVDCTSCPSTEAKALLPDGAAFETLCSCPQGLATFHGSCDRHAETVVLGHNSLGFTFGGFAQGSWAAPPRPLPAGVPPEPHYDTAASGDLLFRLATPSLTGNVAFEIYRPVSNVSVAGHVYGYHHRQSPTAVVSVPHDLWLSREILLTGFYLRFHACRTQTQEC
eukprot:COSAG05_NODE_97_length_19444_cov_8.577174_15_plen_400_part_00